MFSSGSAIPAPSITRANGGQIKSLRYFLPCPIGEVLLLQNSILGGRIIL